MRDEGVREHLVDVFRQKHEELVLGGCEREALAVELGVSRGVIDVQASVVEGARLDGFGGDHGRAPQVGADAGEHLLNRKRLRQVVVGAGVESADLIRVLDARRDDDDGNGRPAADLVDDFDAIDVRQAEVEHDQVGVARCRVHDGGLAVRRLLDAVTVQVESGRHEVANRRVVFDHEDA
ncbi:Uncharacterised protein [Collinsella intestinalis]|nr:Uncharacterised protein [Collinsella intestinalis]